MVNQLEQSEESKSVNHLEQILKWITALLG